MRYANSMEDRVRRLLSERLENISRLFGQLPDTLEDVWVRVALGEIEAAKQTIDAVPEEHPFALRYREVRPVDWESCARVLADDARRRSLTRGWQGVEPSGAIHRSPGRGPTACRRPCLTAPTFGMGCDRRGLSASFVPGTADDPAEPPPEVIAYRRRQ